MLEQLQNDSAKQIAPFQPGFIDVGDDQAAHRRRRGPGRLRLDRFPVHRAGVRRSEAARPLDPYVPLHVRHVAVPFAIDIGTGGSVGAMDLTAATLAKIFTHTITIWADPEILAENATDPAAAGLANPKIPAFSPSPVSTARGRPPR